MINIRKLTIAVAAAVAITALFQPSATLAGDFTPVQITFQKCLVDPVNGVFTGTVDGDCDGGTVVYQSLPGTDLSKSVWRLVGEYTVTNGDCSFIAVASGIANTNNGVIVLNGVVTQGPYAGGQFHVRAELLFGSDGSVCSQGTMMITPTK